MGRMTFEDELLSKGFDVPPSTGHVDWVYGIKERSPLDVAQVSGSNVPALVK